MPDAKSADVYTTDEIDAMIGALSIEQDVLTERVSALEGRVTALEGGDPPDPGPGPGPSPEGADLLITVFEPPDLEQGVPAHLSATVENVGTVDVAPGWDAVVGVGFFVDGVQATWASTDVGLPAGQVVTIGTDTAPMSGGAWRPPQSGAHVLTAYVDDLNRIPEWDDTNNAVDVDVTIAEGAPPPEKGELFPASSSWNTVKDPAGPFAGGADGFLSSTGYGINAGSAWSHPMTWSTASDPIHTIDTPDSWGWPATRLTVNMRDDAQPASGTDGHLALMNADGRMFDFWILRPTGERAWRCESWAQHRWDTGTGWGQPPSGPSAGVTAAGAPTAAGTITAAEIDAGVIPHALCMAADYGAQGGVGTCGSGLLPPAIHSDVMGGPGPLAEGALLLAVGDEPGGLNDAERALWRAASTFGVWVIDKLDGSPCFYGDSSATVGNAFRGDKITDIGRRLRMVVTW